MTGHPSRQGIGVAPDGDGRWQERALCRYVGSELFFPDKGESPRLAKTVCARCPVRAECLGYALTHGERHGVWGGTSEGERRRMAKARLREAG